MIRESIPCHVLDIQLGGTQRGERGTTLQTELCSSVPTSKDVYQGWKLTEIIDQWQGKSTSPDFF